VRGLRSFPRLRVGARSGSPWTVSIHYLDSAIHVGTQKKWFHIVYSLPIAYAFYWLLEAPSHRLAISLSKYFEGTKPGVRRIPGVREIPEVQGEGI
jgi:hypothetical protein